MPLFENKYDSLLSEGFKKEPSLKMKNNIEGKLQFIVDNKKYNLKFERYYLSEQIERIRVFGKEKEILLQGDRPYLRLNNKRKAINWKIISEIKISLLKNPLFINYLLINLEGELERIDFPKQPFVNFK